jgi:hypothetical protein
MGERRYSRYHSRYPKSQRRLALLRKVPEVPGVTTTTICSRRSTKESLAVYGKRKGLDAGRAVPRYFGSRAGETAGTWGRYPDQHLNTSIYTPPQLYVLYLHTRGFAPCRCLTSRERRSNCTLSARNAQARRHMNAPVTNTPNPAPLPADLSLTGTYARAAPYTGGYWRSPPRAYHLPLSCPWRVPLTG